MKTRILFFTILFTSSFYYSQAPFPDANTVGNFLNGSWKWEKSCGGFAYSCVTPTTSGYSPQSIVFAKITGVPDSLAYTTFSNGNLVVTSGTKITYTNTMLGQTWNLDKIFFVPGTSIRMIINMAKPDSVWLFEDCSDCYTRSYSRINTTGINESTINKIKIDIFPNPAKDKLKISIEDKSEIKEYFIYNAFGQNCNALIDLDATLNISDLSPGIYFLSLKTGEGYCYKKFIKE